MMERITSDPAICGGKPCIRGMRIRVRDILEMLAGGNTIGELLEDYPYLEHDDILASLAFASSRVDNPGVRHRCRVNFIVDMQLPPTLAKVLRNGAHNAYHVIELDDPRAADRRIWDHATRLNAAIITKDEDFIGLLAWSRVKVPVVWLRCGNIHNADLFALVERELDTVAAAIANGKLLIELWP